MHHRNVTETSPPPPLPLDEWKAPIVVIENQAIAADPTGSSATQLFNQRVGFHWYQEELIYRLKLGTETWSEGRRPGGGG